MAQKIWKTPTIINEKPRYVDNPPVAGQAPEADWISNNFMQRQTNLVLSSMSSQIERIIDINHFYNCSFRDYKNINVPGLINIYNDIKLSQNDYPLTNWDGLQQQIVTPIDAWRFDVDMAMVYYSNGTYWDSRIPQPQAAIRQNLMDKMEKNNVVGNLLIFPPKDKTKPSYWRLRIFCNSIADYRNTPIQIYKKEYMDQPGDHPYGNKNKCNLPECEMMVQNNYRIIKINDIFSHKNFKSWLDQAPVFCSFNINKPFLYDGNNITLKEWLFSVSASLNTKPNEYATNFSWDTYPLLATIDTDHLLNLKMTLPPQPLKPSFENIEVPYGALCIGYKEITTNDGDFTDYIFNTQDIWSTAANANQRFLGKFRIRIRNNFGGIWPFNLGIKLSDDKNTLISIVTKEITSINYRKDIIDQVLDVPINSLWYKIVDGKKIPKFSCKTEDDQEKLLCKLPDDDPRRDPVWPTPSTSISSSSTDIDPPQDCSSINKAKVTFSGFTFDSKDAATPELNYYLYSKRTQILNIINSVNGYNVDIISYGAGGNNLTTGDAIEPRVQIGQIARNPSALPTDPESGDINIDISVRTLSTTSRYVSLYIDYIADVGSTNLMEAAVIKTGSYSSKCVDFVETFDAITGSDAVDNPSITNVSVDFFVQ